MGPNAIARFRRTGLGLFRAEAGPTAVEYAVLTALVVMSCLAAMLALAPAAGATFSASSSTVGTYGTP